MGEDHWRLQNEEGSSFYQIGILAVKGETLQYQMFNLKTRNGVYKQSFL
jgi:hypothetical protein